MGEKKIAIITTHPIQYNSPFFKLLARKFAVKVFYTWGQAKEEVYDPDFNKIRKWDIPLFDGYEYEFVKNNSKKPGSQHFWGICNPDIINRIDAFSADIILVYGWAFSSHLKTLRYYKGKIPVYFRGDSTLIDEKKGFSFKKIARRFFLKWVYSFIDMALYTGLNNKQYYLVHGLKEDQLLFVPHAIENERFFLNCEISKQTVELRKDLGIPYGAIVFLFAGKFHPKKDPITLVKAFEKLANSKYHLVLAGNGVLEEEMKRLTKNNPNIHILPFQNQSKMPGLYQLCNIFVLPSKGPGETWGLAINEAMAAGKAIIVSDRVGCGSDLIKRGINGYVFNAENINDLSEKMNVIAKSDFVKMGFESLELIKNYSLSRQINTIESKINNL